MNLKHVTDFELLTMTKNKALILREQTLELLTLLSEIDQRKLFCELSYGSLFKYIVDELKFSDSQAAIYNNLVKSKVVQMSPVIEMLKTGEISLFNAAAASQVIRENKICESKEKLQLIQTFAGISKEQVKEKTAELLNKPIEQYKEIIILTKAQKQNIEKLKKKLLLPEDIKLCELITYLVNDKLNDNKSIQENKTITQKTKRTLIVFAKQQCEYEANGKRCQESKYLEVDHIKPKCLGGSNHPSNLRVYCRAHNQKAAIDRLGVHTLNKRTSLAK